VASQKRLGERIRRPWRSSAWSQAASESDKGSGASIRSIAHEPYRSLGAGRDADPVLLRPVEPPRLPGCEHLDHNAAAILKHPLARLHCRPRMRLRVTQDDARVSFCNSRDTLGTRIDARPHELRAPRRIGSRERNRPQARRAFETRAIVRRQGGMPCDNGRRRRSTSRIARTVLRPSASGHRDTEPSDVPRESRHHGPASRSGPQDQRAPRACVHLTPGVELESSS
jgi:hypothetical protein